MKLTFLGAARTVTGSCFLLESGDTRLLVDCGLFQGRDADTQLPFPVSPSQIDYLLVTHAHVDHSGRIPWLVKEGFRGEILSTPATRDLCGIMLRDSAHIQEQETQWRNKKRLRAGLEPLEPLYTIQDAETAMGLFNPCDYGYLVNLGDHIKARFTDAGHLLGSAYIELWVTEEEGTKKLVFSGDIGNVNQPIINDPGFVRGADFVITESTYATRHHKAPGQATQQLKEILLETFQRKGKVIIPAFAVGRTQEILYFLREIYSQPGFPYRHCPVFVDSPLAIEATKIFMRDPRAYYDEEAIALLDKGISPLNFSALQISQTVEDSRSINEYQGPCVIISSSGMCEAGRIKHHLKYNLWRPECTVLFSGYQAVGTLGRSILDGAKKVTIFGESVRVRARIRKLDGISGHGDQGILLRWIQEIGQRPERIFVVHGEEENTLSFARLLRDQYGYDTTAPQLGQSFDLLHMAPSPMESRTLAGSSLLEAFRQLTAAGARLLGLVGRVQAALADGTPQAEQQMNRLAQQVNDLCDQWEEHTEDTPSGSTPE